MQFTPLQIRFQCAKVTGGWSIIFNFDVAINCIKFVTGVDKKSKIFFLVFFLLIAVAVGATYWRIMVKRDYVVSAQTDCDPYTESCFIWECDPASTVEGEACTGDAEKDIWYYQLAERNAANIPLCDPNDETCDPWTCGEGEKDCSTTFCDETTKVEQGVECSDPVTYTAENPIEEEAVECEEGDEECLAAQEEVVECAEGDTECLSAQDAATQEETTGETGTDGTAPETAPTEQPKFCKFSYI